MVIEDGRPHGNKAVQSRDIGQKPVGAGKTMKQKCGYASRKTFALGGHLSPALRSVQYDRPPELRGKFELGDKSLAHDRRNITIFKPIQPDFSDA